MRTFPASGWTEPPTYRSQPCLSVSSTAAFACKPAIGVRPAGGRSAAGVFSSVQSNLSRLSHCFPENSWHEHDMNMTWTCSGKGCFAGKVLGELHSSGKVFFCLVFGLIFGVSKWHKPWSPLSGWKVPCLEMSSRTFWKRPFSPEMNKIACWKRLDLLGWKRTRKRAR